jgi:hypothetical protein
METNLSLAESKGTAPLTEKDQELWRHKHELSQRIRHPLVELNNLIAEAASRGVIVHARIELADMSDWGIPVRDPVPWIDVSVFSPDA